MKVQLLKARSAMMDYYLLDQAKLSRPLSDEDIMLLSEQLCLSHGCKKSGVKSLLVVEPADNHYSLAKVRFIHQSGKEVRLDGHGLQVAATYLSRKHQLDEFHIRCMHADLFVKKHTSLSNNRQSFRIQIEPVSFQLKTLPMNYHQKLTLINEPIPELSADHLFIAIATPAPHVLSFVEEADFLDADLARIGERANRDDQLFPEGVSVSFILRKSPSELSLKTFEPGLGLTRPSGTAVCAASLVHVLTGDGEPFSPIAVTHHCGIEHVVVHIEHQDGYWLEFIGSAELECYSCFKHADIAEGKVSQRQYVEPL